MFLPVLLVRDYGIWGWIVFAIPNVIGAAAMGWTVRDAAHSRRLVEAHRLALIGFAIVTASFQFYFGAWYFSQALGSKGEPNFLGTAILPAVTALYVLVLFLDDCPRARVGMAGVTYAVSIVCFGILLRLGGWNIPVAAETPQSGLWALALACALGFTLCPYLDPTFHEARQQTSVAGGRIAFAIGFGALFLLMIVFTLLYARGAHEAAFAAVAIHILLQLAFTAAMHVHALRRAAGGRSVVAVAAVLLLMPPLGYVGGETGYRLFMSFYGLLFPAYAWLCMLPTWREPQKLTRRAVIVFAAAAVLAAPFYHLAFIAGRMQWVAVGVAIVLASRLFLHDRRGKPALA